MLNSASETWRKLCTELSRTWPFRFASIKSWWMWSWHWTLRLLPTGNCWKERRTGKRWLWEDLCTSLWKEEELRLLHHLSFNVSFYRLATGIKTSISKQTCKFMFYISANTLIKPHGQRFCSHNTPILSITQMWLFICCVRLQDKFIWVNLQ